MFFKNKQEIESYKKGTEEFQRTLNKFHTLLDDKRISARVSLISEENVQLS